MKRASFLLLTLIYLFSSIGVSAKSMYCLGMLKSTTISYVSTPKKDDCKMGAKMKNCCKTKKQYFKIKDQHFYSGTFDLIVKLFPVLAQFADDEPPLDARVNAQQQYYCGNAPPSAGSTRVYALNCSYLI